MHVPPRHRIAAGLAALLLAASGCGGGSTPPEAPPGHAPVQIPAKGTAATLDAATWNLEWFGDTGNGPADEALQLQRVGEVIRGAKVDVWGLQEVVGEGAFANLVASLPGYAGLLANAPSVENGVAYYSDFGNLEQKVALLYDTSVVQVLGAKVVLTEHDHAFAGRPPLEVRVSLRVGAATWEGVILVLHAKAGADEASWARRQAGAEALRTYLDATWPTVPVWVLGDFNDDVDTSITTGRPSPYASFLAPGSTWSFPTSALSAAGVTSTAGYADVIDHQLVSDETWGVYQAGSVEAWRLDSVIPDYANSTTDHFPVLARYALR